MKDFLRGYWPYLLGLVVLWFGLYWQAHNEVVRVPESASGMRQALKANSLYIFTQYRGQRLKPGDIVYVLFERVSSTGALEKRAWLGRVVALAGERVAMREGRIYVNGKRRAVPFVEPADPRRLKDPPFQMEEVVVPQDCVFVLVDDRTDIVDSRIMGPVPLETIVAFRRR